MVFILDDDMAQTLPSYRTDDALGKRILPWRPRSDEYFIDVHGFHPVADRVFWFSVVRKCCGDLVSRPASCGMTRDVEMGDLPPVVTKDDKAIQDFESDRGGR